LSRRAPDAELVLELARGVRERVAPSLGSLSGRTVEGEGAGGDPTFAIDSIAEEALAELLAARAPEIAVYTEDRGLIDADEAEFVLVVDPIDGTRPAMAGLESCCVAVALAPLGEGAPTMADVSVGCVVEIKTGAWFLAVRDGGVLSSEPVRPTSASDVSRMFWGYGFRGRPARETVEVLGDLIDASSVGGGTFELGSQAFAMTRVVTGQLDAVVEVGSRLIDDVPGMRAEFERVGGGRVLNNSPYDLAAPWLCLREAGGIVTDGWGAPLDRHRLLGAGHDYQMSSISASNPVLHAQLVRAVDEGIARLRSLRA
jgi:myo-inositol-1(or 4)-monophosphatase